MAREKAPETSVIKGWGAIAIYLGMMPASAQRWAKEGMTVKREGRNTVADPIELQAWLGRESHMAKPAHVMTGDADIPPWRQVFLACTLNLESLDMTLPYLH